MMDNMNTLICPGFECQECDYKGVTELQTLTFGKDSETYTIGDKIPNYDYLVGFHEFIEGVFCPKCLAKKKLKIYGVIIVIENGFYKRAVFD